MKKLLYIAVVLCLIFSLTGCAKLVSTEYENVEVKITDKYHRAMWMQPVCAGKVTTIITHPAKYEIVVEYKNVEYTIDDSDTYDRYKDKIGQITTGTLEVCTYDDGTVKYNITELN